MAGIRKKILGIGDKEEDLSKLLRSIGKQKQLNNALEGSPITAAELKRLRERRAKAIGN